MPADNDEFVSDELSPDVDAKTTEETTATATIDPAEHARLKTEKEISDRELADLKREKQERDAEKARIDREKADAERAKLMKDEGFKQFAKQLTEVKALEMRAKSLADQAEYAESKGDMAKAERLNGQAGQVWNEYLQTYYKRIQGEKAADIEAHVNAAKGASKQEREAQKVVEETRAGMLMDKRFEDLTEAQVEYVIGQSIMRRMTVFDAADELRQVMGVPAGQKAPRPRLQVHSGGRGGAPRMEGVDDGGRGEDRVTEEDQKTEDREVKRYAKRLAGLA
ncbi:MAG: hypothetical protein WC891_08815 [Actinomycetota bacterium]